MLVPPLYGRSKIKLSLEENIPKQGFKNVHRSLAMWLSWLEHLLKCQKVIGLIQGENTYLDSRLQVWSLVRTIIGGNWTISLFLSLNIPLGEEFFKISIERVWKKMDSLKKKKKRNGQALKKTDIFKSVFKNLGPLLGLFKTVYSVEPYCYLFHILYHNLMSTFTFVFVIYRLHLGIEFRAPNHPYLDVKYRLL